MDEWKISIPSEKEREFYGKNVHIITKDDKCALYRIADDRGESVITRYEVYPGIALAYNDVHMEKLESEDIAVYGNVLEINHCREGRIEFETIDGEFVYIKNGDMAINTKASVKNQGFFPSCHFHGVTIEINFDALDQETRTVLNEFDIDLLQLKEMFCYKNRCYVLHGKEEFEHLFSELYCVSDKIRSRYYKLKVIEILLYLSAIDVKEERTANRYFNRKLVATVKEIQEYLVKHYGEKITIDELANKYQVAPTSLKQCFHEVYGNSIYAYMKTYRMQKAAEFLRTSNYEISKIAGMVGYDNASKFSKSFKSMMGLNPRDYKKNV